MPDTFSDEERGDLAFALHIYLGDYEDDRVHGADETGLSEEDQKNFEQTYDRLLKLYYTFTGTDFNGSHGYMTNFEMRN